MKQGPNDVERKGLPRRTHAVSLRLLIPFSLALPEIEVRFSENGVMVRIVCVDAKGVVVVGPNYEPRERRVCAK